MYMLPSWRSGVGAARRKEVTQGLGSKGIAAEQSRGKQAEGFDLSTLPLTCLLQRDSCSILHKAIHIISQHREWEAG